MEKKSDYLLLIGISILILATPIIFTRPSFCDWFDLTKTGPIGDTIGGITAPIINILGACFVYFSFREQLKANKIQTDSLKIEVKRNEQERKYNSLMTDINNLRMDINDFRLLGKSDRTGANALFEFETNIQNYSEQMLSDSIKSVVFKNFYFLIASTDNLLKNIQKSDLTEYDKKDLSEKLLYLYTSKVGTHAQNIITIYNKKNVEHELLSMLVKAEKNLTEFIVMNHI